MIHIANPVHRYQKLWLAIGYALVALVIYLTASSHPPDSGIDLPNFDKVMHALAYFVLMGWFAQLYHVKKHRIIYALIFVFMGIALEIVQSFDPARSAELADMVANASGVLLAFLLTRTPALRRVLKKIETFI
ncbi:MAG: VanZ family protein [Gammaproteobacteria bacterium]|jgi:VanZ family protein|nr:VanZ family protein [Gammaproteobacteria bacterium]